MAHILDLQLWADDLELNRLPALNDELVSEIQARTDGWTLNSVRIDAVSDAAGLAQADASLALSQIYAVDLGAQNALLNTIQNLKDQLVQEVTDQVQAVKDETDQKIQDQIDSAVDGAVTAVGGMSSDMLAQYNTAMGRMDSLLLSTDHLLDTELPTMRSELELASLQAQQALSDFNVMFTDYTYPTAMAGLDEALTKSETAKLDAAAAAQLAIDNLNLAKDYTDTSITDEHNAWVAGDQALATQIQTLTAVLNSENYIINPRFIDGKTGWGGSGASPAVVTDQDAMSSDPIVAGAPTPKFLSLAPLATDQQLQQIFDITDWQMGEKFQWRLRMGSNDPLAVRVRTTFRDSSNTNISYLEESFTLVPGEWRTYSKQQEFPVGTERIAFIIYLDGSAYTEPLGLADVSATRVDTSIKADLTALELAFVNHESAQTLWQSNAESRFTDAEDELDAVAVALSNRYTKAEADAATVSATNSLKATLEGPGGSIKEALDGLVAVNATLDNDYLTTVDTNAAISLATTSLKSSMESAGGSVYLAQQAAQAANDLAGGKGKVFFQTSAPATAERLSQNLWIDTTGGANTPKRWNGTAWVAVTDKVATDAAVAAASALAGLANKLDASVITNYYTKTEADNATAMATTQLSASLSQALNNASVILTGRADPTLLPYGTNPGGAVSSYTTMAAGDYGSDADGVYALRDTSTNNASVYLRNVVPAKTGKAYRVTIRFKPTADLTVSLMACFLSASGTNLSNSARKTITALATDGKQELSMVFGRTAGGLVDSVLNSSFWDTAAWLRFGIRSPTGVAGSALQVYEIEVEDVTEADAAARMSETVAANLSTNYLTTVNVNAAIAASKTEMNSRMDGIDSTISTEATTRANADTALGNRTTALESTVDGPGGHSARLSTVESTVATQGNSLSSLTTRVEASSTVQDLVLDPTFAQDFAYWSGGTAASNFSFLNRNLASGNYVFNAMPAPRALVYTAANQAGGQWKGTSRFPVTVGEEILLSMSYARNLATGVVPRLLCRCYDKDGVNLGAFIEARGELGGAWNTVSARGIVPAGAVEAQVYLIGLSSGSPTTNAWITNVSAKRGQEAYASGLLKVEGVVAGPDALARAILQVRADGQDPADAAIYLEAMNDGTSTVIVKSEGFFVTDGTTTAPIFAVMNGEVFVTGRLTAQYLDIDGLITIKDNGALSAFKESPDDTTDGIYFGKIEDKFALSASRTAVDGKVQEVSFTSDGFRLTNPRFFKRSSSVDAEIRVTATTGLISLVGKTMVRIPSAIGGGGGGVTSSGNDGTAGTATIIKLWDGSTLMETITAAGGLPGSGSGPAMSGIGEKGLDPGNRGGGGSGAKFLDGSGRNRQGRGGEAGKIRSRGWVDISAWADPKIEIIIGAAGTGGGFGTSPAVAGAAIYQTAAVADVQTDTLPPKATFAGSFTKLSNAAGSFPDLGAGYGAGIWEIYSTEEINFVNLDPGDGNPMTPLVGRYLVIIASKTPTYGASSGNPTIAFRYFAMGET